MCGTTASGSECLGAKNERKISGKGTLGVKRAGRSFALVKFARKKKVLISRE